MSYAKYEAKVVILADLRLPKYGQNEVLSPEISNTHVFGRAPKMEKNCKQIAKRMNDYLCFALTLQLDRIKRSRPRIYWNLESEKLYHAPGRNSR